MSETENTVSKSVKVDIQGPAETKEIPIEAPSDAEVPSIYVNAVGCVATPFDVRLNFGQIKPKGGKLANEQLISVVMSWEHAKAMTEFLRNNIEEHEREFGTLHYTKTNQ